MIKKDWDKAHDAEIRRKVLELMGAKLYSCARGPAKVKLALTSPGPGWEELSATSTTVDLPAHAWTLEFASEMEEQLLDGEIDEWMTYDKFLAETAPGFTWRATCRERCIAFIYTKEWAAEEAIRIKLERPFVVMLSHLAKGPGSGPWVKNFNAETGEVERCVYMYEAKVFQGVPWRDFWTKYEMTSLLAAPPTQTEVEIEERDKNGQVS
jgi:hypothetical protein